jgi:hypothetical protein
MEQLREILEIKLTTAQMKRQTCNQNCAFIYLGEKANQLRFNLAIAVRTHSYKDNAKFNSAFSATTLSHASRFRRQRGVIENFEQLGEFKEYFRKKKCWLNCVLYLQYM